MQQDGNSEVLGGLKTMGRRDEAPAASENSTLKGGKGTSFLTRRQRNGVLLTTGALVLLIVVGVIWVGLRAVSVKSDLSAAMQAVPVVKTHLARNESVEAAAAVESITARTAAARASVEDPVWTLASVVPFVGSNLAAVAEVARSADDVSRLGLAPLVGVFETLDWNALLPSENGSNLQPLKAAAPKVSSAAEAVRLSADRLREIDETRLLPQVAQPLVEAREQLQSVEGTLSAASDAAAVLPGMLGSDSPRSFLLMIQNNAEARASGGIPGALAILEFDGGKLSLETQSSASDFGTMNPALPVDGEQQQIYTSRLGKYMQDVNLTPDFPTAASTAQAMWERRTGQRVDGVISIDPVALSYLLDATGPVNLNLGEIRVNESAGLPARLSSENVVQTLLSDVYSKIESPHLQDLYFASVAQQVFAALSNEKTNATGLIEGIIRSANEGRALVWSATPQEQLVISSYKLSGSISGPSTEPGEFGVYFNDGTGAKMDYYMKRSVQLIKECAEDGYEQVTVRVISTNLAPKDAGAVLPNYVTAGGAYGVPPGSVQTNIVAYGPIQSMVETVRLEGQRSAFAPYMHSNRPVGVIALQVAPGETKTVDFAFSKIVQHTEPNLVVTPTVQDVKDVTLPMHRMSCN
ncbi:DUF4012 domain-containing protein [Arthrobacter sp. AD-310]